jgi:uncharacterized protein YjbJ (UPF0337 family)
MNGYSVTGGICGGVLISLVIVGDAALVLTPVSVSVVCGPQPTSMKVRGSKAHRYRAFMFILSSVVVFPDKRSGLSRLRAKTSREAWVCTETALGFADQVFRFVLWQTKALFARLHARAMSALQEVIAGGLSQIAVARNRFGARCSLQCRFRRESDRTHRVNRRWHFQCSKSLVNMWRVKGGWSVIRGKLRRGGVRHDSTNSARGREEELAGRVHTRHGSSKEKVRKLIDDVYREDYSHHNVR